MRSLLFLLSTFFLLPAAQAQIIYRDVAPDSTVTASNAAGPQQFSYNLNFDGQGGTDLSFNVDGNSSTGAGVTANLISISVEGDSISIGNPIVDNNGKEYAEPIEAGTNFGPGSNLQDISVSELWLFEGRDVTNQPQVDFANVPFDRDTLLGFSFQSSGNTHYGWVRIQLARTDFSSVSLTVLDWAYNGTPDSPIEAGTVPEPVATPAVTSVSDLRDAGNVSDVEVEFTLGDETDVDSFLVFFQAADDPNTFDRGLAETTDAGRYGTVDATGAGTYPFTAQATQVDINGQNLVPDSSYVAYVLAAPTPGSGKISALSATSQAFEFTTVFPATNLTYVNLAPPPSIPLFTEEVAFTFMAPTENGVADYQIFAVLVSDTAAFDLAQANAPGANSLLLEDIAPGMVQDTLPEAFSDNQGVAIENGPEYALVVASINPSSGRVDTLSNYAVFQLDPGDAVEPGSVAPGIQLFAHQRTVYTTLQPEHLAQSPRLTLTNQAGQQLLAQPLTGLSSQVAIAQLPAGLYLAELRAQNGALLGSRKLLLR